MKFFLEPRLTFLRNNQTTSQDISSSLSTFGISIVSSGNGSNSLPVQSTFSTSLGGEAGVSLMGLGGNGFNNSNYPPSSRFITPLSLKKFVAQREIAIEATAQRQRQVGALNLDDVKVCF